MSVLNNIHLTEEEIKFVRSKPDVKILCGPDKIGIIVLENAPFIQIFTAHLPDMLNEGC